VRGLATLAAVALALVAACRPSAPRASSPPNAPTVIAGGLDAKILLGDIPYRASQLGAGPARVVASGPIGEGERLGAFVDVPSDACLLGYARASSSVEDIDVVAFAEEGNPLAADEAPDAHPTILVCPPHPDRVYLAVHAAAGEGLVALAAQIAPRARAAEVAAKLGARGSHGEGTRSAEAWPGLDELVRAHRAALGGHWAELKRVAVTADARSVTVVPVSADANQCLDVLAVGDDSIALLDLEVADDAGRVVARAHEGPRERSVVLCTATALAGSLHLRPHVGNGLAAVVVARMPLADASELTERPETAWYTTARSVDQAKRALDTALGRAGYGAGVNAGGGTLALGRRASLPLDPTPSACSRVDVVAGAPLALFDARVWDERGSLLASGEGASQVALFVCRAQKTQLELEARGRPGPFGVVVRKERWQSQAFLKKPLAASRMLARSADAPSFAVGGTLGDARVVALDAGKRSTWDDTVPPKTCAVTTAGAEGEGTGLTLVALDAAGGPNAEEIDRSHAASSARVRVCAADAARRVRYELTVSTGKLDVVVGQRRSKL
jgi:hypothetical protein